MFGPRVRAVLFGLALALCPAAGLEAKAEPAPSCEYSPLIIRAANFLLEERKDPPRFWRDLFGSDAAYLKIRYGGLDRPKAVALFEALKARSAPPQRIGELALAHGSPADRAAALLTLDNPTDSVLRQFGASGLRSLVLQDGGKLLIKELVRWRDAGGEIGALQWQLYQSLGGIGDELLAEFATLLESEGFHRGALAVLALKADLSDAYALIGRLADGDQSRREMVGSVIQTAILAPDFDPAIQPAEIRAALEASVSWKFFRPIALLAGRFPEATLLSTLLNQTGETRIATELAAGLLADIQAGRLDPAGAPDAAVIAAIGGLDEILGRGPREDMLGSLRVEFQAVSDDRSALAFADAAVARAALAPSVAGKGVAPPTRPALISGGFDWDRWRRVAADLAAGRLVSRTDRVIAALLLESAGKPREALNALLTASDEDPARLAAHTIMRRFDRRCAALLSHPMPYHEPLYRFE